MKQKPFHVLHITASYKPAFIYGGPVRSTLDLCMALNRAGIAVNILTTTANGRDELYVSKGKTYSVNGLSVRYFGRWTGDHSHFSPALLCNVWRTCKRTDAVHIHSWWNLVSVLSLWICNLRGVRAVVSLRGTLSSHSFENRHTGFKSLFHRLIGSRLLQRAILHVTSDKEADEVLIAVPGAKVVLIPNLLTLQTFYSEPTVKQRARLKLLFVGRIHPIKNLHFLLSAMCHLQQQNIPCDVQIVGTGDVEYVAQLRNAFRDLNNVLWSGPADDAEKFSIMREADVLVLLSHTENFGNVVIEALSQGTAVIVSEYVGASTYVLNHRFGWVIPSSVEAFAHTIKCIREDRTLLNDIRTRAPQQVSSDFGPDTLTQRYINLYQVNAGIGAPDINLLQFASA